MRLRRLGWIAAPLLLARCVATWSPAARAGAHRVVGAWLASQSTTALWALWRAPRGGRTVGAARRSHARAGGSARGMRGPPAQLVVLAVVAAVFAFQAAAEPAGAAAQGRAGAATNTPPAADDAATDLGITPLVPVKVRRFVESTPDLGRSSRVGWIVVPLMLILLSAREILAAVGRPGARMLLAFGVPLVVCFVVLVIVRIEAYRQ
jgi:hypothetical protein